MYSLHGTQEIPQESLVEHMKVSKLDPLLGVDSKRYSVPQKFPTHVFSENCNITAEYYFGKKLLKSPSWGTYVIQLDALQCMQLHTWKLGEVV